MVYSAVLLRKRNQENNIIDFFQAMRKRHIQQAHKALLWCVCVPHIRHSCMLHTSVFRCATNRGHTVNLESSRECAWPVRCVAATAPDPEHSGLFMRIVSGYTASTYAHIHRRISITYCAFAEARSLSNIIRGRGDKFDSP